MTTPNEAFKQQAVAVQQLATQLMGQAGTLWTDAAERSDSAQGLGVDARINLVHNLVDIWVKGYAGLLQSLLKNKDANEARPAPVPVPSQAVTVDSRPYDRLISAGSAFTRLGIDATTIPQSCLEFQPPVLKADETDFKIALTDYEYLGANYTGLVVLTRADGPAAVGEKPDNEAVTVGL
jgi:hypothetical protein